jgi:hypothetical protein
MTIGAGLFLIAVGAILRFGVTVSTPGFSVWAPWGRSRRSAYRGVPPPDEVRITRRYPGDGAPYEDQYPR